jgi:hypothetical protein
MNKILNIILLAMFVFLSSCGETWQSVKRGLTGEKKTSSDEFLVKKKDPLVVPPNFERMPAPGVEKVLEEEAEEIESILSIKEDAEEDELRSQGSVEENVLKRLKKNK